MGHSPRRLFTSLLLLALAASVGCALAPDGERVRYEPCDLPGLEEARCGTLSVPEDRGDPEGRTIEVHFAVLPARGAGEAGPLFFLAGGPGASALGGAAWFAHDWDSLRERHDFVFVDQRGTGRSHPLECDLFGPPEDLEAYLGDFLPLDAVRRCLADLGDAADPRFYTTGHFVADLDEVRRALGYERINLYGLSYGTRVGLELMRRHPESVRAAVLHGLAPPDDPVPLGFPRAAQGALDGVLADCAAEPACRAAFPDLEARTEALFARLEEGPARVEIVHPATGEPVTVPLSRDLAAEAVRYLLYSAARAALLPAILWQVSEGDLAPLAEFALFSRRFLVAGGTGLYLSVTCAEDLPFVDEAEALRLAEGTFLGAYRYVQQRDACRLWPRGDIPEDFRQPVRSGEPALLVSGARDPVTPPAHGERVAAGLARGHHLVVPGAGHDLQGLVGGECVRDLIAGFLAAGSPDGLDDGCLSEVRRTAFRAEPLPTTPVELPAAALAALAGTYRSERPPLELRVEARARGLALHLPDGTEVLAVPVTAERFRLLGLLGAYILVDLDEGGRPRRLVLEEGGPETVELTPVES